MSGPVVFDGITAACRATRNLSGGVPEESELHGFSGRWHSLGTKSGDPSSEAIARAAAMSRFHRAPHQKGQWEVKYAKSAAAVAGSVMALGAAVPAFAAESGAPNPTSPSMSLNGGLMDLLNGSGQLDSRQLKPLVDTVRGAEKTAKHPRQLLGGATGATKDVPLLGGLPLAK
ncbi:hypothetical protein [Streptomyces noursei]|uniref:hypothetical protein n=1 Tax=Streptomyces noursei TaxID=1971 RepID=UPI0030B85FE3